MILLMEKHLIYKMKLKTIQMKNLSILIIVALLASCGSSKGLKKNAPKTDIKTVTEVIKPKITEVEKATKTVVEAPKEVMTETKMDKPEKVEPVKVDSVKEMMDKEPIPITPEAFDHASFNDLLQTYVSIEGNVDYTGIKTQRAALNNYIASLSDNMPADDWSKEDKLAYWMNAYNALTIDLILRNYPIESIKDIKNPWDQRLWKLGDKWYNLNQIEHDILRKMDEPRIHFGIVCASFSCPKLQNKAYTATNLEAQLTTATREFLADEKRNSISEDNLKISKIFKWFSSDFTKNGKLVDFINTYTDVEISSKAKKSFREYNWSLNN